MWAEKFHKTNIKQLAWSWLSASDPSAHDIWSLEKYLW